MEWLAAQAAAQHVKAIHEEALARDMKRASAHVSREKNEASDANDAWQAAEDKVVESGPVEAEAVNPKRKRAGSEEIDRNAEGGTEVSAAVMCIVLLCLQFFVVFPFSHTRGA